MQNKGRIIAELYRKEAYITLKSIAIKSLGNRLRKERERGSDKYGIRSSLFEQLKKMKEVQVVDICGGCNHWWVQIGDKRLCLLFSEYKGNAAG